ncbi:MAG: hypothetical protein WC082_00970 [Victivallales bacterium]|jgi:hypothetical protein
MHKIFHCLCLTIFAATVIQADSAADKERERLILKVNYVLEQTTVLEYLKKCVSEIRKDGKTLPAAKYSSYLNVLNAYSQNRWFVADTGLSEKWFSDVRKLMEYMHKTRDIIETAIHNHQTGSAKYKQTVEYFNAAFTRFAELVKKPVRVSAKVRQQAGQQKLLWRKAMKKKYNIKP